MAVRRSACLQFMLAGTLWIAGAAAGWAQTRVLKCVAADGSVSYLDARNCPGDATGEVQQLREHQVTLTREETARAKSSERSYRPPTPAEVEQRKRLARLLAGVPEPDANPSPGAANPRAAMSYRCTLGGTTWYQHHPCKPTPELESQTQGGVEQEEIPRAEACREIHRPGAILRRGSELDERTDSYDRSKGKDKC